MSAVSPQPARELRWWSADTLEPLRTQLTEACATWSTNWGVTVQCTEALNACEAVEPTLSWQPLAKPGLWWGGHTGLVELLHAELFGSAMRPDTLAADVARRAADSLCAALAAAFSAPQTEVSGTVPPQSDEKPWLGAVRFRFSLGVRATGCLHASASHVAAPPKRNRRTEKRVPRLTPVLQALSQEPIPFKVELASVELTLGELQSLQRGDVITLPHRLDSPLSVRPSTQTGAESEVPVACLAYLGARHGHRAIEFLRTDTDLA